MNLHSEMRRSWMVNFYLNNRSGFGSQMEFCASSGGSGSGRQTDCFSMETENVRNGNGDYD